MAPVGSPALSHSWARCPQSPISPPSLCCSWDLPQGELRHSGPQNPWSWGSAAPMSHWLPWGLPCALLGTQPLSGATFSHQTMAREPGTTFPSSQSRCGQRQEHICSSMSQPVHFGSGTRSALPNHIRPVPECPRSPHGTSASSLAWLNGLELGAKGPRARLPSGAGQRHRCCHPPGLEHGPQPWGGASRLRGDALPAPQPLPAGAEPGVSARREGRDGLAGWAGCRQRVGGRWGADVVQAELSRVQAACRVQARLGRSRWGAGKVQAGLNEVQVWGAGMRAGWGAGRAQVGSDGVLAESGGVQAGYRQDSPAPRSPAVPLRCHN